MEEREQGIRDIQEEIGQTNEIFKDLAVLVYEQGVVIGKLLNTHKNASQFLSCFLVLSFACLITFSLQQMTFNQTLRLHLVHQPRLEYSYLKLPKVPNLNAHGCVILY